MPVAVLTQIIWIVWRSSGYEATMHLQDFFCVALRITRLSPFVSPGIVCLLPAFSLFQCNRWKWMQHPYHIFSRGQEYNLINCLGAGAMQCCILFHMINSLALGSCFRSCLPLVFHLCLTCILLFPVCSGIWMEEFPFSRSHLSSLVSHVVASVSMLSLGRKNLICLPLVSHLSRVQRWYITYISPVCFHW